MKKHKLTFLATSIFMGLIPLLVAAITNVKTIHDGIQISNDATEGIMRSANELSKGSMHIAASVQNTAASMQNVGESISSIAESAAAAEAREIETINNEAKDNLSHLIKANKNTVTISENIVMGINEANTAIDI